MSKQTWVRSLAVGTVIVAWVSTGGPARADDKAMGEDEKAIRELIKKIDTDQPATRTDDSIYSTGPSGTLVGKAEQEKAQERLAALAKERGKTTVKTTVERVVVANSGDLAYEFSRFRMDWAGGTGKAGGFDGVYLRVWRKVEAEWREDAFFARPHVEPKK
jgi:ketosteroid isomerase-like protein